MWIIPKNLPIYRYAQDTKALGVDSEEFSQMSENSLMWRSKPSLSQTWLRRWKRVSYIQRLSTQTLKPSHTKSFVEKWTSSLRDSHVNPSHRLVAELPQTILDTFTPTSQRESRSADQLMLFSKMSRGLSVAKQPMGSRYSSMSSEIWKKEVIEHRGEYSLRLKLELHTNGRESLSWPTARLSDGEGGRIETVLNKTGFKSKRKASNQYFGAKLRDAVETYEETKWIECKESSTDCKEKSWPTPAAHEARLGYQRRHAGAKGTQKSLTTVVIEDGLQDRDKSSTNGKSQESWATPTHQDSRIGPNNIGGSKHRRERGSEALADQAIKPSPKATGKLNPNWVEQMMGLPVGWTQLPTEWID